jgi:hypothetical protein
MTKHAPTPWRYDNYGEHISFYGHKTARPKDYDFRIEFDSAVSDEEREANAEFIVTACNHHEEMLENLRGVETLLDGPIGDALTGDQMSDLGIYDCLNIIRALIQKIEGE